MTISRRHKLAIIFLAMYWPTLFVLAHIRIPGVVRRAGVSDKGLHFIAYMVLTFLFWLVFNPHSRVCWRKVEAWGALLAISLYGVVDELLQGCVGRSCDFHDFVADFFGAVAGLLVLTFFSFRLASVLVCGVIIFGLTNIARANLSELVPVINAKFHFFGYAGFTVLWIHYMQLFSSAKARTGRWLAAELGLPMVLLLSVKICSVMLNRGFPKSDVILALVGIAAVEFVRLIRHLREERSITASQEPLAGD